MSEHERDEYQTINHGGARSAANEDRIRRPDGTQRSPNYEEQEEARRKMVATVERTTAKGRGKGPEGKDQGNQTAGSPAERAGASVAATTASTHKGPGAA